MCPVDATDVRRRAQCQRVARLYPLWWALLAACFALACQSSLATHPSELPGVQRAAARQLPLEGAHNARDVGGYPAAGGRHTRWGTLYRSDKLATLTDQDLAYLAGLGLRSVIDFRSQAEREREPDRIPEGVPVTLLPIEGEGLDPAQIEAMLRETDAEASAQILVEANEAFVREFAPQYRAFLLALADRDNLPALFHCTAGKDRAGFATAVALMAVGVSREDVMRDYLLTEAYTADRVQHYMQQIRQHSQGSVDTGALAALLSARREYLQAAFDAIDRDYGGTEAYLRDGLSIDAQTLAKLRENLLE